jgi:transcription antitermination protein NusB
MRPSLRRKARRLAAQAIYQWQFDVGDMNVIRDRFVAECNPKKVDVDYFIALVNGVVKEVAIIDKEIANVSGRKLKDLNLVELAILRAAVFELLYRLDIPYKVVIDEALESNKIYGAREGVKFVNGVLDKIAQKARAVEYAK